MKQLVVLVLVIGAFGSQGKHLPSYITKCKRNDPGLNECMKNHMLDFRDRLKKEVKELKLASMDPYIVPKTSITTSWMNGSLTNLELYYSNQYNVDYFKIDLENGIILVNLTAPFIYLKSSYELDGKLLQFVLHGEGELQISQNNTKSLLKLYGSKMVKNGKEYLNLTNIDYKMMDYLITNIQFHDLFRDNPELTERINSLINENISDLAKDVVPLAEGIISSVLLASFKGSFDNFSLNELFD